MLQFLEDLKKDIISKNNNFLYILNYTEFIFKFEKCRHIYKLYVIVFFDYIVHVKLIETTDTSFSAYFQITNSQYPSFLKYQDNNIICFNFYKYKFDNTLKL